MAIQGSKAWFDKTFSEYLDKYLSYPKKGEPWTEDRIVDVYQGLKKIGELTPGEGRRLVSTADSMLRHIQEQKEKMRKDLEQNLFAHQHVFLWINQQPSLWKFVPDGSAPAGAGSGNTPAGGRRKTRRRKQKRSRKSRRYHRKI